VTDLLGPRRLANEIELSLFFWRSAADPDGAMRFNLEASVQGPFAEPLAVQAVAQSAERAGFTGLGYTDHPAPSAKWLQNNGHETYDPFAALSFCAAVTTRLRLMTYLAVLPYRNPLLTLKAIATVDRLSGGRLTLVVGSGYLRSEFLALGRPFEARNELTDEALEVITTAWTGASITFEGKDFTAKGQVCSPAPVQRPHPPIWVGGTSRKSRERVARHGQGWAPLLIGEAAATTVRSAVMPTIDDLARRVDELRELVRAEGRDPSTIDVQCDGVADVASALAEPEEHARLCERLADAGVTHLLVRAPHPEPEEAAEAVEAYGASFIQPDASPPTAAPTHAK
jgi:probable F420-dependent oxidoreductase